MKNKNIIKYALLVIIMLFMLLALTACSNNEENTGTEVNPEEQVSSGSEERKIETTGDYTKWPAGVYAAYGVPEFTGGTIGFAEPYNENGNVYIKTDINNLRAYIYLLKTKGFRISESDEKSLKAYDPTDEFYAEQGISGTIYAPTQGAGYTISYSYQEKVYEQTVPPYSFENMEEEYTFESNCTFSISIEEYPEENIESDLLTEYGLSNEDVLPKFKTFIAERNRDNEKVARVHFDFGYDSSNSEEDVAAYKLQVANACERIADDGKIYNNKGDEVITSEEDKKGMYSFVYKYQGVEYRVVLELFYGLGGSSAGCIAIEPK